MLFASLVFTAVSNTYGYSTENYLIRVDKDLEAGDLIILTYGIHGNGGHVFFYECENIKITATEMSKTFKPEKTPSSLTYTGEGKLTIEALKKTRVSFSFIDKPAACSQKSYYINIPDFPVHMYSSSSSTEDVISFTDINDTCIFFGNDPDAKYTILTGFSSSSYDDHISMITKDDIQTFKTVSVAKDVSGPNAFFHTTFYVTYGTNMVHIAGSTPKVVPKALFRGFLPTSGFTYQNYNETVHPTSIPTPTATATTSDHSKGGNAMIYTVCSIVGVVIIAGILFIVISNRTSRSKYVAITTV